MLAGFSIGKLVMRCLGGSAVILCALLLGGCAGTASMPSLVGAPSASFDLNRVTIGDVTAEASSGATMAPTDLTRIALAVKGELRRTAPGRIAIPGRNYPDLVDLKLIFTDYDPGNAMARYMLAGLGQIHIQADMQLIGRDDKQVRATYDVSKRFAWGGIYGASTRIEDVEIGFVKSVAATFDPKYAGNPPSPEPIAQTMPAPTAESPVLTAAVSSAPYAATQGSSAAGRSLCYTALRDALYYAGSKCITGDRLMTAASAEVIRNHFLSLRGLQAGSSDTAFAAAPAGTRVETTDGGAIDILGAEDRVVSTYHTTDRLHYFQYGWFHSSGSRSVVFDRRKLDAIWPLEVGKKTSYRATNNTYTWENDLEVLRREKLTLAAGTFDTYVVRRRQVGLAPNFYDAELTYWYAPSAGLVVKFDVRVNSGTRAANDERPWEARRIMPPPPGVTQKPVS